MHSLVEVRDCPVGTVSDANTLTYDSGYDIKEEISFAQQADIQEYTIFFSAIEGGMSRKNPRGLKQEITTKVQNHSKIDYIRFTRNNNLICVTKDIKCAQEIITISKLQNVKVNTRIQYEGITSRFLIFNIDTTIPLNELKEEIEEENSIKIKEMRRFTRREVGNIKATETVLITTYGAKMPKEIKLYYTIQKIERFIDRPRQCQKCKKFNHATKFCPNELTCNKCAGNHQTEECKATILKCSNCGGNHEASKRECEAWVREEQFLIFKCKNNLPFTEARRKFAENTKKTTFARICQNGENIQSAQNNMNTIDELRKTIMELKKSNENLTKMIGKLQETIDIRFNNNSQNVKEGETQEIEEPREKGKIKSREQLLNQKRQLNTDTSNTPNKQALTKKKVDDVSPRNKNSIIHQREDNEMDYEQTEDLKIKTSRIEPLPKQGEYSGRY